jgi:hypothetical protein
MLARLSFGIAIRSETPAELDLIARIAARSNSLPTIGMSEYAPLPKR